jgi:uncharacterized protein YecA (UPF0149 family)
MTVRLLVEIAIVVTGVNERYRLVTSTIRDMSMHYRPKRGCNDPCPCGIGKKYYCGQ